VSLRAHASAKVVCFVAYVPLGVFCFVLSFVGPYGLVFGVISFFANIIHECERRTERCVAAFGVSQFYKY